MAAQTLDQVVVELDARVGRYNSNIEGAASVTEKSLQRIENSATKMERQVGRSFGEAAQRARNLGFQISDIGVQLSSGTSPFIVLAQQGPQVANALDGARGAVGRFATFLSGPYGAAILAATTILGGWLMRNKEAGESVDDLVEKLRQQERQSRLAEQASERFGITLEGVEKATKEAEKAIEALRLVQKGQAQQTRENIAESIKDAETARDSAKANLDRALSILELQKAQAAGTFANAEEQIAAENNLDSQIARVKKLQDELAKLTAEAQKQRKLFDQAVSRETVEEETASAAEKINRKFDAAIDRAASAANASKQSQAELRREIQAIEAAREAELKRLRDTQRESRKSTSSLPAVTGQEIARALGTRITSGTRTPAENAAARGAKNSYHLSGQAIDIPLTVNGKPLTKAGIRAALEPLGIEIKELLGPGDKGHSDHFHIAFSKKRRGADEVAADSQRAADTEERRRQTFENELAALLSDELAAKRALTETAEEQANLRLQDVEAERQAYADNLDSLVAQRKLRAEEADQLRQINDETAKYRAELIKRNEEIRAFRVAEAERQRNAQYDSAFRGDQVEALQGQAELARTLDERNNIERRIVDLQYEEEKARNDFVIAAAERLRTEVAAGRASQEVLDAALGDARIAKMRNASIADRRAGDIESIGRNNPIDRYLDEISDTKTRAQEATVRELQEVRDGISEGLAEEFGIKSDYVKDLFSIFLDEVIFRPLTEAMRNRQSGGGGLFGSIIGAIGGLFGGGKTVSGGASIGIGLPGRASGGPVEAGRLYRLNEAGMEGFVPASSGTIIPAGQMNAIAARGGAQPAIAKVQLMLSDDIDARMVSVAGPVAVEVVRASAPGMIDAAANETMRRAGRPTM